MEFNFDPSKQRAEKSKKKVSYIISHGTEGHVGMVSEPAGGGIIARELIVERLQVLRGTVAQLLGHIVDQVGLLLGVQIDGMRGQLGLRLLVDLRRAQLHHRVGVLLRVRSRAILIEGYVRVVDNVIDGDLLELVVFALRVVDRWQDRKRIRAAMLSSLQKFKNYD
jgi:hypothetical protein